MDTNNLAIQSIYRTFRGPWHGESKIVLGIDIGTTYSGVAFAYLVQGGDQILNRVDKWPGQEAQNFSGKIPTLVWYNDAGKAASFGAEASSPRVQAEAEENGWQLAKHFKLHLHPKDLRAKHKLALDPLPCGVNLSTIYADFLRYLLEHTRECFETTIINGPEVWRIHSRNMEVVIAHPNGWGVREQVFLRTSSVVAGFTLAENALDHVHFVTEAEASVHFCIHYTNLKSSLHPYTTFAVCDAGGSTVDSTVYYVEKTHPKLQLSETRTSACVQAGSIFVDKLAEAFLRQFFESRELPWEEADEYVTTGIHNFEFKEKRKFGEETSEVSLGVAGYRCKKLELGIRHGELKIPASTVRSFFDPCVNQIIESVESQTSSLPVSYILLVGGFGSNPYLHRRLKNRLDPTGCQVISTTEATSKAVADGAVVWHCVNSVIKRAPRLSYGIATILPYCPVNPEHVGRKRMDKPSGTYVNGQWSLIVHQDIPIDCDEWSRQAFNREFGRSDPNLDDFQVRIYGSPYGEVSEWIRDKSGNLNAGFREVCTITANLSAMKNGLKRHKNSKGTEYWTLRFHVCIRFGRTELEARLEWVDSKGILNIGPATVIVTDDIELEI
ncbi:unnamed protein product [Rhizoctonia solani]|uniref:Heat shock 70 kDa protein 12A n=1 Tax=Rhizoctonia solani TaxID=456999 RepID=A0A8H3DMC9_9AGAM|nr:unnamed protein product [Rhizoctonia solani]CAE6527659.1 unnamed protein product [Rhizoctonia solani]